jgi:hypothetical protein
MDKKRLAFWGVVIFGIVLGFIIAFTLTEATFNIKEGLEMIK